MFISLHSQQSPSHRTLRRYPLTPPTVTPPSLSTNSSSATRQDNYKSSNGSAKATQLLSKVALSPTSRRCSASSANMPSPTEKSSQDDHHEYSHAIHDVEEPHYVGYEAIQYWNGHEQRDGYISFPDFERYRQSYESHSSGSEGERT